METGAHVTATDMAGYRATVRRHQERQQHALAQRRQRAWAIARDAAHLLKERCGATRVMVLGSLRCANRVHACSDVDIAAWGLAPHDTFRAIEAVLDLATDIAIPCCPPRTNTGRNPTGMKRMPAIFRGRHT